MREFGVDVGQLKSNVRILARIELEPDIGICKSSLPEWLPNLWAKYFEIQVALSRGSPLQLMLLCLRTTLNGAVKHDPNHLYDENKALKAITNSCGVRVKTAIDSAHACFPGPE